MAEETKAPPPRPRFLPLSEETLLGKITNDGILKATEALRSILFDDGKETPFPWTVKAVMIEVERDGRRYEVLFVGEKWAGMPKKKPSREMLENIKKTYEGLDQKGKEAADAMFEGIAGAGVGELLRLSETEEEKEN